MAVLSDAERVRVWRAWMRRNLEPAAFSKVALRDAINATDDWIDTNATAFNAALPSGAGTFRATASATQKTLLFCYVALDRAGLLGAEGD